MEDVANAAGSAPGALRSPPPALCPPPASVFTPEGSGQLPSQRMKHELLHPKAPRPARAFKFTCPGQPGQRCWCRIRKNSPFAPSWDKLCSSFYSGAPHRIRLRRGLHLEWNPGFSFPHLLSPSPYWSGTISLGNHLHVKLRPI